jgi:hypothetical protein
MPWVIDTDHIADKTKPEKTNANAVGVVGPRGYKGDGSELTHKFRMKDDDGELYYEGRSDDDSSFDPLDHFGGPNAGATTIEYWVAGKGGGWKPL